MTADEKQKICDNIFQYITKKLDDWMDNQIFTKTSMKELGELYYNHVLNEVENADTHLLNAVIRTIKPRNVECITQEDYYVGDLAWIDNIPVELLGGIVFIAILLLPAFAACGAFAVFDQLLGFEFAAIQADFGINQIDFIAYVYAIGNGLLVAVFADDVLIEKAKSAVVRCGG